jgi:hypothetical protein
MPDDTETYCVQRIYLLDAETPEYVRYVPEDDPRPIKHYVLKRDLLLIAGVTNGKWPKRLRLTVELDR